MGAAQCRHVPLRGAVDGDPLALPPHDVAADEGATGHAKAAAGGVEAGTKAGVVVTVVGAALVVNGEQRDAASQAGDDATGTSGGGASGNRGSGAATAARMWGDAGLLQRPAEKDINLSSPSGLLTPLRSSSELARAAATNAAGRSSPPVSVAGWPRT